MTLLINIRGSFSRLYPVEGIKNLIKTHFRQGTDYKKPFSKINQFNSYFLGFYARSLWLTLCGCKLFENSLPVCRLWL